MSVTRAGRRNDMPTADRGCRLAVLLVGIALLIETPLVGAAPVSRDVAPSDRIRYVTFARGGWTQAWVLEVEGHSWLVRAEGRDPSWITTSSLRRAEVFRRARTCMREGFLLGFVPGAILGASAASLACLDHGGPGDRPVIAGRFRFVALFGGVTGGIGALIGRLVKTEDWDPIVRGRVRVSLAPMPGPRRRGVGASISVSF